MATIEQIGEWIIANQDKQGTPEADPQGDQEAEEMRAEVAFGAT